MKGAGAHCAPLREKGHAGGKGGSGTRPYGAVELRFVGRDDLACPSWGGRPQRSPLRRTAGGGRAPPLRPPMVRIPCRGAPLCAPAGSGNRYGPDKITPPGGMGPLTVQRAAGDAGPYGRGGGRRARTARPYGRRAMLGGRAGLGPAPTVRWNSVSWGAMTWRALPGAGDHKGRPYGERRAGAEPRPYDRRWSVSLVGAHLCVRPPGRETDTARIKSPRRAGWVR